MMKWIGLMMWLPREPAKEDRIVFLRPHVSRVVLCCDKAQRFQDEKALGQPIVQKTQPTYNKEGTM